MLNRDFIGHVSEPTSVLVEVGQLRLFNKAIGETRDIYTDIAAARAAGHRSILAPLTFGACLYKLAPATGPSIDELGINYAQVLHGEEHHTYYGQIYAGDVITLQASIVDMYDKKDGALEFVVQNLTMTNQLHELVQERRWVLVMKYS